MITEFTYTIYIQATPEKIWDALRDPELTKLYWGRAKNVSDWNVGSKWSHGHYDDDSVVDVEGTIVASEPPRRLVVTWKSTRAEGPPTRVTYEISTFMDAARLTVTHAELEPDSAMFRGVSSGWPAILSSLKTLLETGVPMPMTTRRFGGPPPSS